MSEPEPTYETETADALEMLGKGYDSQPAAIIESPRKAMALSDAGLTDYQVWGWVKISAKFIAHIKRLKGAKLAIWQTIALSIDADGECKLSANEIAEITGYSRSEVLESQKELDEMGYLTVSKKSGKRNIYKPEFAARSSNSPTTEPKNDQSRKTTGPVLPLESAADQSSPSEVNSIPSYKELKELIKRKPDFLDGEIHFKLKPELIRRAVKQYFRINVDWETKYARQWIEWVVKEDITAEQMSRAAESWKANKLFNWQPPTLKGIFEKWDLLMESQPTTETQEAYRPRITA